MPPRAFRPTRAQQSRELSEGLASDRRVGGRTWCEPAEHDCAGTPRSRWWSRWWRAGADGCTGRGGWLARSPSRSSAWTPRPRRAATRSRRSACSRSRTTTSPFAIGAHPRVAGSRSPPPRSPPTLLARRSTSPTRTAPTGGARALRSWCSFLGSTSPRRACPDSPTPRARSRRPRPSSCSTRPPTRVCRSGPSSTRTRIPASHRSSSSVPCPTSRTAIASSSACDASSMHPTIASHRRRRSPRTATVSAPPTPPSSRAAPRWIGSSWISRSQESTVSTSSSRGTSPLPALGA